MGKSQRQRAEAKQQRRIRRLWMVAALVLIAVVIGTAQTFWATAQTTDAPVYGYKVINVYPHDDKAFCQGLVFDQGTLYEGTGKFGESSVRKVDLKTGRVLEDRALGVKLFGEGITIWNDTIIQLSWRAGVATVYDRATLRRRGILRYEGEGWGLTNDDQHLIMSNGSDTLQFLDPQSMRVVRSLRVTDGSRPVSKLNELEYIDGEIYANIWYDDRIARISPTTGKVTSWIDLTGLLDDRERPSKEHVLNGIAYDKQSKRLLVTGKWWPKLFEIEVVER